MTSGSTPLRSNPDYYEGGKIPWFKTGELHDGFVEDSVEHITERALVETSVKLFPANTVLMAMYGDGHTITTLGMLRTAATTNQACAAMLVDESKCNPRYLFYALMATRKELLGLANGGAQRNLSCRVIKEFPVPAPQLAIQNRIGEILGSLDEKIELNRRMNETLEAMARAIFRSWFVDFDPVRIKARGGDPTAELGLSPEIAALFPDSFQDSELGKIPEGWELKTIGELVRFNSKTLGSKDSLGELEYVEISGVSRGNILETTWYNRLEAPSRARRRLTHGDTVVSTVRPDKGAYFLALFPQESLVASTGFAVLTPKLVPWTFLHAAMTQHEVFEYMGRVADGGAYPAISPALIGDLPVSKPTQGCLVDKFHALTTGYYELSHGLRNESRHLAETRDYLLPLLLSGKIDVSGGVEEPPYLDAEDDALLDSVLDRIGSLKSETGTVDCSPLG